MTLQDAFIKIENYLRSDKKVPYIVDVQNNRDYEAFQDQFAVGRNEFRKASDYCNHDERLRLEDLLQDLSRSEGTIFLTELSTFLKLESEYDLKRQMKSLLFKSIPGKQIVVTYQCSQQLRFNDPRISTQIVVVDGERAEIPQITFAARALPENALDSIYDGIEHLAHAVETADGGEVTIYTKMSRNNYPLSMFTIHDLSRYYDILANRDHVTKMLLESYGTEDQWCYALNLIGTNKSWAEIITDAFGSTTDLSYAINNYNKFDGNKKWLYYIGLKLYGGRENNYLKKVISSSDLPADFTTALYRTILQFDRSDRNFTTLYDERKVILSAFADNINEITEYCKIVETKGKDAIYYLTDLSQPEKEKIITLIVRYAYDIDRTELLKILGKAYPDLQSYLLPFRFRNELLDSYFQEYKYQKVINKILPGFMEVVEQQAAKRDFMTVLNTRTSHIEQIDTTGAELYFIDAMGVEYLSFIAEKCRKYGLSSNISYWQAELPTLTCFNKEFEEHFESKRCKVNKVKDLDDIKHHGTDNFDYENTKLPLHLIRELEIVDEVIAKIKAKLSNGTCKKAVIIADHGASRLAVIHETENQWEMSSKGEHSGRCCPTTDFDAQPAAATQERDFWILANYDRFKGGRKANVEVHGGASLEEVTIPIVEIMIRRGTVETFVLDAFKRIKVGRRKNAAINLYVGEKRQDIYILQNNKPYDALPTENDYVYSVDIPDITKKGSYVFDVYAGSDLIASGLSFEAKSMLGDVNDMI